ncbi:hypothetical protein Agub_g8080 [Astrephomene gubernaculifera]|uniref:Uncharacterized protein n=1 Tax=Astrephomene gubernaculifera TaxID=47775 RepID=A0AAD3DR29_9CHLO|nr:hypothetical protein Agub_g8080 [Astrephomene gubernaculifera]
MSQELLDMKHEVSRSANPSMYIADEPAPSYSQLEDGAPGQDSAPSMGSSSRVVRGNARQTDHTPPQSAGADRPSSVTASSLPSREASMSGCRPISGPGPEVNGITSQSLAPRGPVPGTSDSHGTAGWAAPWSAQANRPPSALFLTAVAHAGGNLANPADAAPNPKAPERRTSSSTTPRLPEIPGAAASSTGASGDPQPRAVDPRPVTATDELLAAAVARLHRESGEQEQQQPQTALTQQQRQQAQLQDPQPVLNSKSPLMAGNTAIALGLLGSGPLAPLFDNGRPSFRARQPSVVLESAGRRRLVSRDGCVSPTALGTPAAAGAGGVGGGVRTPAALGSPTGRTLQDSASYRGLNPDSLTRTATLASWPQDSRRSLTSSNPQRPSSSSPLYPSPPPSAPHSAGLPAGSGAAGAGGLRDGLSAGRTSGHITYGTLSSAVAISQPGIASSSSSHPSREPSAHATHSSTAVAHVGYAADVVQDQTGNQPPQQQAGTATATAVITTTTTTTSSATSNGRTSFAGGGGGAASHLPPGAAPPAKRRARMQAYSARRRTHGSPTLSPEASEQMAPVLHLSTVSPMLALEPLEQPKHALAHVMRVLHMRSGMSTMITRHYVEVSHHVGARQAGMLPHAAHSFPAPMLPSVPRFTPLPQQQPPAQPLRPLLARSKARGVSARNNAAAEPRRPNSPPFARPSQGRAAVRQGQVSDASGYMSGDAAAAATAAAASTAAAWSPYGQGSGPIDAAAEAAEVGAGATSPRTQPPTVTVPRRPIPYSAAETPIVSPTSLQGRAAAHAAAMAAGGGGHYGAIHAAGGDSPIRGGVAQPLASSVDGTPTLTLIEEKGAVGPRQPRARSPHAQQQLAMGGPFSLRRTVYYDWVESTPLAERLGAGNVGGVIANGLEGKALVLKRQLPDRSSPVYFKPAYQKPLLGGDVLHVL